MKVFLVSSLVTSVVTAFAPSSYDAGQMTMCQKATKADLEKLAEEANPYVKFWDPLSLAEKDFWGFGNEATIGWLRHSEIKHGRGKISRQSVRSAVKGVVVCCFLSLTPLFFRPFYSSYCSRHGCIW